MHFVQGLLVVDRKMRGAGIAHDRRLEKQMARSPFRCMKDSRNAGAKTRIGVELLQGGCFSADSGIGFFSERQLDVTEYFSISAHDLHGELAARYCGAEREGKLRTRFAGEIFDQSFDWKSLLRCDPQRISGPAGPAHGGHARRERFI